MWNFERIFKKNKLCVLMYHHVGPVIDENGRKYFIAPETFAGQLDIIIKKGFHPVSLSEMENSLNNKTNLPEKSVLITLDDGWIDNYHYAFPIAKEKKIPITVFLNPALTGKDSNRLSWEQIREMHESGLVDFASHGAGHKRLRDLSDEEALSELKESKLEIEKFFGTPCISFCYPYGAFDRRIRKLVFQAGYLLDFSTRKGVNSWPWRMKRPLLRAWVLNGESLDDFQRELERGRK